MSEIKMRLVGERRGVWRGLGMHGDEAIVACIQRHNRIKPRDYYTVNDSMLVLFVLFSLRQTSYF